MKNAATDYSIICYRCRNKNVTVTFYPAKGYIAIRGGSGMIVPVGTMNYFICRDCAAKVK